MKYPSAIQNLIDHFILLPSVGPKTAERYALFLLKQSSEDLQKLAQAIAELKEKILVCRECLAISENNPCEICRDSKRDQDLLCVVANTRDMLTIEATQKYQGRYFILGKLINVLDGIQAEALPVRPLINTIKKKNIKEIILAISPTIEGETTAMYIAKMLKPHKIKVTRLARGLPTGADLEYTDQMTLINALQNRNEI